ncbi:MAG: hypothetical protein HW421_2942 [Ignavibacteria bacterium]|nr:hypothetical protein [Ignavibacteria bacterium]
MKKFLLILILICWFSTILFCQADKVRNNIKLLNQGKVEEVKKALPDLLAEFPDDPGVMLLHGLVVEDAGKALEFYKKIVKYYPQSEWADDALWRIVQYYSIIGDTAQAQSDLKMFKRNYPGSIFLSSASDVVNTAVSIARSDKRAFKKKPAIENSSEEQAKFLDAQKSVKTPESPKKPQPPTVRTDEPKFPKLKSYTVGDNKSDTHTNTDAEKQSTREKSPVQPVKPALKNKPESHKETEESEENANDDIDKGFGIQVGVFSTHEAAKTEVEKYIKKRLITEIIEKTVKGEKLFAVIIGNYSTHDAAEAELGNIRQKCGCQAIIFER